MKIDGKVHCLFEQSGTFKNEFKKLGIPAEDYDIQNNFAQTDHAKESDCPDSFKFLMLLNGWHNPFVALNELLKVIYTNEMLLKRNGMKKGYKSRYREMEKLVQEHGFMT